MMGWRRTVAALGFTAFCDVLSVTLHAADTDYNLPEDGVDRHVALRPVAAEDRAFDTNRFPRLKWLDSTAGEGDAPPAPFLPVEVDEPSRTLRILGRELVLNEIGLPSDYVTHFNGSNTAFVPEGQEVLRTPFALRINGSDAFKPESFRFLTKSAVRVSWRAEFVHDRRLIAVEGELGFDGFAAFRIFVPGGVATCQVGLGVRLRDSFARYQMGLGRDGGLAPESYDWTFNAARHQDAVWLGGVNGGMMIRFKGSNYEQPLINAYYRWKPLRTPDSWGNFNIRIRRGESGLDLSADSEAKAVMGSAIYAFDLYLTPFKLIDIRKQVADRYCQIEQHTSRLDLDDLVAEGVTVVNLHHNTLWNPYINYPYNDDGGPLLRRAVKDAHKKGLRLKVYYTTREITQNMPELPALAALGDEVIFRRPVNVDGWPVTNPDGPHPWLVANIGEDILPAWRETISFPCAYRPRLDLAVITNPGSRRWNNFYLAGLDYLVKEYGIDGIYVDDTALNRAAIMRARRILDRDGDGGRRIDMHSWSHRSRLAGGANSAIVFMELYPFVDRLWYGEGFPLDRPAEFWLIERSGLPFGLMSEQLMPDSPFRGMVYLMTGRYRWCNGDPRPLWRFFDESGLGESAMVGWWDPDCPARFTDSNVKVTLFLTSNGFYLALANFANRKATGRLQVDWEKLGAVHKEVQARVPSIRGLQTGWEVDNLATEWTFESGDGLIIGLHKMRSRAFIKETSGRRGEK